MHLLRVIVLGVFGLACASVANLTTAAAPAPSGTATTIGGWQTRGRASVSLRTPTADRKRAASGTQAAPSEPTALRDFLEGRRLFA